MNLSTIFSVAATIIASVGGAGVIICAAVSFCANVITDRLEAKYQQRLSKELEAYKSKLENKTYISKTRFDAEFSMYQQLSKAFFQMVKDINYLIPYGLVYTPADEEARKQRESENYTNAENSAIEAQDALFCNAVLIPTQFYKEYDELRILGNKQILAFQRRWNLSYSTERKGLQSEDFQRTKEINEKFDALNASIREYLSKLDVLE